MLTAKERLDKACKVGVEKNLVSKRIVSTRTKLSKRLSTVVDWSRKCDETVLRSARLQRQTTNQGKLDSCADDKMRPIAANERCEKGYMEVK